MVPDATNTAPSETTTAPAAFGETVAPPKTTDKLFDDNDDEGEYVPPYQPPENPMMPPETSSPEE